MDRRRQRKHHRGKLAGAGRLDRVQAVEGPSEINLPSIYSPADVESRLYAEWEASGVFKPDLNGREGPFTIVIPPPNVTGVLHMGHALNNTLQDILIRWKRMQGYSVLWVPGTDHAGIATQNVVERQIAAEKLTRQQLGREKFIERVWAWKQISGSTIVTQLRRLGSSCDWSRERFTMDEGLSRAVETAFLTLYDSGLVYRGYYLVNWCPRCQTALSDEEVMHEELKGHLWYIRYPAAGAGKGVVVATTRPETMLGDVAVAVNPHDTRYLDQFGDELKLPLTERSIPIIGDEVVDPKFGTGAVKVTPAHDPTDFQIMHRHKDRLIPLGGLDWRSIPINIFTPDAKMIRVPPKYVGMDRFECRKQVVVDLEQAGLLVKTEEYTHSVGHCYRCKTVIEPRLSPQWFVKMEPLAKLGIEAVEKDGMRFVPERWTKVYLDWLRNIRDWCISRQIWWGHRIPAWYCPRCSNPGIHGQGKWVDGRYKEQGMIVMSARQFESSPPKCSICGGIDWIRDEDVLDTWFSSWLWPFSTLGWPEKTKDLATFYPTSVLVTAQDIIFFWVVRMVMAGKFFLKKIPFKDVYIHGIIRVEGGKKMSKSLGNIIDPLEVIDRMGADGLRFSIARMTSEGQDLYLSEAKFLLGRNFANKLWNAARLIFDKVGADAQRPIPHNPHLFTVPDRWICSRFQQVAGDVTRSLAAYRFNEAARQLYQFIWHDLCDWYLEVAKLQIEEGDPGVVQNTKHILWDTLKKSLRLLHPFMPFITGELWRRMGEVSTIMTAAWPEPEPADTDPGAEQAFERVQRVITEVRNIRATFRLPVKEKVSLLIQGTDGENLLNRHLKIIQRLGTVDRLTMAAKMDRPAGSVVAHLGAWDLIVPLAGLVDLKLERQRIQKEMESIQARVKSKKGRLGNSDFCANAPAEIVAEEEGSVRELEQELAKWTESLKNISDA